MAARVEALNGRVSYKTNSGGSQSAYELNINYLAALGDPEKEKTPELRARDGGNQLRVGLETFFICRIKT